MTSETVPFPRTDGAGPQGLLDRRLLILAGKGGVGRTTMAAALARVAARRGKRVLLAQTNAPERLGRMLGSKNSIGPTVTPIDERISAVNMSPKAALQEYGMLLLRYEPIYRAVFENKPMRSFLGAFPGLDYWTMLGKTWWHTTERQNGRARYDLVILDGPASGHAVAMLRIPEAVKSAMPRGPLARDATAARALLSDPGQTAVVLVSLPEELPARETVALVRDLRELAMPVSSLIINAMPPAEATSPPVERVLSASPVAGASEAIAGLLAGASVLASRRRDAERIVAGLADAPALPMIELPRLPCNDLGPQEIDHLADLLSNALA
jgi:anion-transporting  ArsA/GET3 family ATPase